MGNTFPDRAKDRANTTKSETSPQADRIERDRSIGDGGIERNPDHRNPIGKESSPPSFGVSFIQGKALISFSEKAITPWLRAKDVKLEVPNVRFPFDVSGGAKAFRNRWCKLVSVSFEADQKGLSEYILDLFRDICTAIKTPLQDIELSFGEGFVEMGGNIAAGKVPDSEENVTTAEDPVPFTVKFAFDASTNQNITGLLYEPRSYQASNIPSVAILPTFLDLLEKTDLPLTIDSPTRVSLEPLKPYLLQLFPRHGWKLPDFRGIRLSSTTISKGKIRISFDTRHDPDTDVDPRPTKSFLPPLDPSVAFSSAEDELAKGNYDESLNLWLAAQGLIPDHPFAAERLLSFLTAGFTSTGDAKDLAEVWLERDPDFLPAIISKALCRTQDQALNAAKDLLKVSDMAAMRGETLSATYAAICAARVSESEYHRALNATGLDESNKILLLTLEAYEKASLLRPNDLRLLDSLARIYPRVADFSATERTLKKLLSITNNDKGRADLHLKLGYLHSQSFEDLGAPNKDQAKELISRNQYEPFKPNVIRAKLHLDAALRHNERLLEAWQALGDTCSRSTEPLRAIRCFERTRELFLERDMPLEAAQASRKIAALWEGELDHPENAILRYRQVLDIAPDDISSRLRYGELSLLLCRYQEAETAFHLILDAYSSLRIESKHQCSERAIELSKAAVDSYIALSEIAKDNYGDYKLSLRHLQSALCVRQTSLPHSYRPELVKKIIEGAEATKDYLCLAKAYDQAALEIEAIEDRACMFARSAETYTLLSNKDPALDRLSQARAADSESQPVLIARTKVLKAFGEPKDYALSLIELTKSTADPEVQARAHLELGMLNLEVLQNSKDALQNLGRVFDKTKDLELIKRASTFSLTAARNLGDAQTLVDSLIRLASTIGIEDSQRIEAHLEAALITENDLEDIGGAIEILEDLRTGSPQEPRTLWHLARLRLETGQFDAARSAILDFKTLGGPESAYVSPAEFHTVVGDAAFRVDDFAEAAHHLCLAIESGCNKPDIEDKALTALLNQEKHLDSVNLLESLASRYKEINELIQSASHHKAAALICELSLNDKNRAIAHLKSAIELHLPVEEAKALLGKNFSFTDAHEEILSLAKRQLRLASDIQDIRHEACAELYLACLSEDPQESVSLLIKRAEGLLSIDETLLGVESFQFCLEIHPGLTSVRQRLIELLKDTKPAEALCHLEYMFHNKGAQDETGTGMNEDPALRLFAVNLAYEAGLREREAFHLGTYLALDPTNISTSERFIELLKDSHRFAELYSALIHHGISLIHQSDGNPEAFAAGIDSIFDSSRIAIEKLNSPELARSALDQVFEHKPDHLPALERILPLLDDPDNQELRIDVLSRLSRSELPPSKRVLYLCLLGDALLEDKTGLAIDAYSKALELEPVSTRASDGLANASWKDNEVFVFANACSLRAQQAAILDENDNAIRLLVAARLILDQIGDTKQGLSLLNLLLKEERRGGLVEADLTEAIRRRLSCNLASGNTEQAIEDLSEIIEFSSSQSLSHRASLYRRRGALREENNDIEGAGEDWAQAHALSVDDPLPLERLIYFAEMHSDFDLLAELLHKLARLHIKNGAPKEAITHVIQASEVLHTRLSEPAEAIAALRFALETADEPEDKKIVLKKLRELLLELAQFGDALPVVTQEAELVSPNTGAGLLLLLASLSEAACEHQISLAATRRANKILPNDPLVAAPLMRRLLVAGSHDEVTPAAMIVASYSSSELALVLDCGQGEAEEYLRLAAYHLAELEPDSVWHLLESLCEANPYDHLLVDTFFSLCLYRGDTDTATKLLETHFSTLKQFHKPRIARQLANLASVSGNLEEEAGWLREALVLEDRAPTQDEALRLFTILLKLEGAEQCLALASSSLVDLSQKNPDLGAVRLNEYSIILIEYRQASTALELISRFQGLCPNSRSLLETWLKAAEIAQERRTELKARALLVDKLTEEGDSDSAAAHQYKLGLHYETIGDYSTAYTLYNEALKHRSRDLSILERALLLSQKFGDHNKELKYLRALIDISQSSVERAEYYSSMGFLLSGPLKSVDKALSAFRSALDLAPDHPEATEGLMRLLLVTRKYRELAELYDHRSSQTKGASRCLLRMYSARFRLESDEPINAISAIVDAQISDLNTFLKNDGFTLLDRAHSALGMHSQRAQTRLAATDSPDYGRKCIEAGDIYRDDLQDLKSAASAYLKGYRIKPDEHTIDRLRVVYTKLGDELGLARLAEDEAGLVHPGPLRQSILCRAGDHYRNSEDIDKAISLWRAALEENPNDIEILERLREGYIQIDDDESLAEILNALTTIESGSKRADRLLEIALLDKDSGHIDSALKHLLEAESCDPQNSGILKALGDLHWEAGNIDEAAGRYQRIVSTLIEDSYIYERLEHYLLSKCRYRELAECTQARAAKARSVGQSAVAMNFFLKAASLWNEASEPTATRSAAFSAFTLEPSNTDAFTTVMSCLSQGGDPLWIVEILERHTEALLEQGDIPVDVILRLIEARYAADDLEQAIKETHLLPIERMTDPSVLVRTLRVLQKFEWTVSKDLIITVTKKLISLADPEDKSLAEDLLVANRLMADVCLDSGQYTSALEYLHQSIRLSTATTTKKRLAEKLIEVANECKSYLDVAEGYLVLAEIADDTEDNRIDLLIRAADLLVEYGTQDKATYVWELVFESLPSNERAYRYLSETRSDPKDKLAITQIHLQSLTEPDQIAGVLREAGNLALALGETDFANSSFIEAFRLNPRDETSARMALPALRELNDSSLEVAQALRVLADTSDPIDAVPLYTEAAHIYRKAGQTEQSRMIALTALNQAETVVEFYKDPREMDPRFSHSLHSLVEILIGFQHEPLQQARFFRLSAFSSKDAERSLDLARAAELSIEGGDIDSARRDLDNAVRYVRRDPEILSYLLDLHLYANELDRACGLARSLSASLCEAEPLLRVAQIAQTKGRNDLVSQLLTAAISFDKKDPLICARLVESRRESGDFGGAAPASAMYLQRLQDANHSIDEILSACAQTAALYKMAGQLVIANSFWERVLDVDPRHEEALDELTQWHLGHGSVLELSKIHLSRSKKLFELGMVEEATEAALVSSSIAIESEELAHAKESVILALEFSPDHTRALAELERIENLQKAPSGCAFGDKAEPLPTPSSMEEALKTLENAEALANLGKEEDAQMAYSAAFDWAIQQLESGVSTHRRQRDRILAQAGVYSAQRLLELGPAAEAYRMVNIAHQAGADGRDIRILQAHSAQRAGFLDIARNTWVFLIDQDPEDFGAYEGLIGVANEQDDTETEIWSLTRLAEVDNAGRSVNRWLVLAARLEMLDRIDEALHSLGTAFDLEPDNINVFNLLKRLLESRGEIDSIMNLLREHAESCKEERAKADAYFEEGCFARERAEDVDRAIDAFSRCLELDPGRREAAIRLASILGERGEDDLVEEIIRKYQV